MKEVSYVEIRKKYLKAPTFEEILFCINEMNVTYTQFERFYGLHNGIIKHIKRGDKKLPVKHWPIIYDRITPSYGLTKSPYIIQKKEKEKVPKKVPTISMEDTIHERLKNIG